MDDATHNQPPEVQKTAASITTTPVGTIIEWTAPSHALRERSSDWYWSFGIIVFAFALGSILYGNYLFAILVLVGSLTLLMHAWREPKTHRFALNEAGLAIDGVMHSYSTLESFWIDPNIIPHRIVLQPQHTLSQAFVIPIEESSREEIRARLLRHLVEKEQHEGIASIILYQLGF